MWGSGQQPLRRAAVAAVVASTVARSAVSVTVVESCSAAAFATSLDHVLNASALAANATVRHAVAARYGAFAGREIAVAAGAWCCRISRLD